MTLREECEKHELVGCRLCHPRRGGARYPIRDLRPYRQSAELLTDDEDEKPPARTTLVDPGSCTLDPPNQTITLDQWRAQQDKTEEHP